MQPDGAGGLLPDAWTQDFFDTGASYLPSESGKQRLAVAMRLKPPMPSGYFVQKALFGPDWAHTSPFHPSSWDASSPCSRAPPTALEPHASPPHSVPWLASSSGVPRRAATTQTARRSAGWPPTP